MNVPSRRPGRRPTHRRPSRGPHRRAGIAAAVVAALVCAGVLAGCAGTRRPAERPLDPTTLTGSPRIVFRDTAQGPSYGRVAMVPLDDPAGPRSVTPLSCDRVDVAGAVGLCLTADRGVDTTYEAYLFDDHLRRLHTFAVSGVPSRARLSPDGHLAAVTVFTSGGGYAGPAFTTSTTLYDVRAGRELGSFRSFRLIIDGRRADPDDVNAWGVTFARDDDTFYVTLAEGDTTYLARGSLRARTVRTLTTNVECPSLSPDGTRIAFKQRVTAPSSPAQWWATVLDPRTMRRTVLADTRNVDDQIAWYDNGTIAYGLPRPGDAAATTDTWTEPADGSGRPRLLVPGAWSAAIVRPPV
jgi:hypothetical protein